MGFGQNSGAASNQMSPSCHTATLLELPQKPARFPAKPCPLNGPSYAKRDPAVGEMQKEGKWCCRGTAATITASLWVSWGPISSKSHGGWNKTSPLLYFLKGETTTEKCTTKQSKLETFRHVYFLLKSASKYQYINRVLFSAHISKFPKYNYAFLLILIRLEKL